jgi:hypothetical protein
LQCRGSCIGSVVADTTIARSPALQCNTNTCSYLTHISRHPSNLNQQCTATASDAKATSSGSQIVLNQHRTDDSESPTTAMEITHELI